MRETDWVRERRRDKEMKWRGEREREKTDERRVDGHLNSFPLKWLFESEPVAIRCNPRENERRGGWQRWGIITPQITTICSQFPVGVPHMASPRIPCSSYNLHCGATPFNNPHPAYSEGLLGVRFPLYALTREVWDQINVFGCIGWYGGAAVGAVALRGGSGFESWLTSLLVLPVFVWASPHSPKTCSPGAVDRN